MQHNNHQPPEHPFMDPNGDLQVHSIFATFQGEGPFAGQPAVFVRLAGCNLQCPHCDTEYTSIRETQNVATVLAHIAGRSLPTSPLNRRLVVLTGGEPMRQNIVPLVNQLYLAGYWTQIETNGIMFPYGVEFQWHRCTIVCSPKASFVHDGLRPYVRVWKYVVEAGEVHPVDGLPTMVLGRRMHVARPNVSNPTILIQPADNHDHEKNEQNILTALDICTKYNYRLSLQLHKTLHLP